MMCCAWQPFFAADHIGDLHQMIIDDIGEMISWITICFQKHFIIQLSTVENDLTPDFILDDN